MFILLSADILHSKASTQTSSYCSLQTYCILKLTHKHLHIAVCRCTIFWNYQSCASCRSHNNEKCTGGKRRPSWNWQMQLGGSCRVQEDLTTSARVASAGCSSCPTWATWLSSAPSMTGSTTTSSLPATRAGRAGPGTALPPARQCRHRSHRHLFHSHHSHCH